MNEENEGRKDVRREGTTEGIRTIKEGWMEGRKDGWKQARKEVKEGKKET